MAQKCTVRKIQEQRKEEEEKEKKGFFPELDSSGMVDRCTHSGYTSSLLSPRSRRRRSTADDRVNWAAWGSKQTLKKLHLAAAAAIIEPTYQVTEDVQSLSIQGFCMLSRNVALPILSADM